MEISKALDTYLTSSQLREPSLKEKKFYLSDMGKCLRVRWLKRKGVETEFDPFVNWTFKMGDLIHEFGYKALEAQGLLMEAEDYVETENFIGRFDGTVKSDEKGKKSVFDFKSVGSYKMKKILAGEDDEENISQLLSYVLLLKEKRRDISDTAYMIYINKEPSKDIPMVFFQREYHLTNWRAKQIVDEMDNLSSLWKKSVLPPCTCPSWMKSYNSYQPFCQAKDTEVKKYLKELELGNRLISTKTTLYLENQGKRKVLTEI